MQRQVKGKGQVFTPLSVVRLMLDYASYTETEDILRRHIVDNSCGDGAFLVEIVRRYCSAFTATSNDREALKEQLETYIHGIEIEPKMHAQCLDRLDSAAKEWGLCGVKWDVRCQDALSVTDLNHRMHFVVGNPPYVRVHNLEDYDAVKRFDFAEKGMTDLYIVFFELCFRMLSFSGTMCLITPSSWLQSKAGSVLRQYITRQRNISGLVDLGHYIPFEATTYTLISRFQGNKEQSASAEYCTYDGTLHKIGQLTVEDMLIGRNFYLAPKCDLQRLRSIREGFWRKKVEVKNGFATLADRVFIADDLPKEACVIDIIKASTGKWSKCVFPYDKDGKPLSLEEIKLRYPLTYAYLNDNKDVLQKRDADPTQWYLFGRTQALADVKKRKYAINSLIRDERDVKLFPVSPSQGIYSGLYILTDLSEETLRNAVCTKGFATYIRMLKNYKSGGYYTFSSKDLQLYLNYALKDTDYDKHGFSEHCLFGFQ